MDDATITQEEPLIKERFPSVVDTDDLIFELGKQAVKAINYEKLLDSMLKKTQALSAATSDVTQARSEMEAEKQELQKSNALYQENNRRLDAALVKVRNDKAVLEDLIPAKDKEIETLNNVIREKDTLIGELTEKVKLGKHNTGKKRRKRVTPDA